MPEDNETTDAAYQEGKAAERSEPVSRNPHEPNSASHRCWLEGHCFVTEPDKIADDLANFA